MVIPHTGHLVEDFTEPGVLVGAYYHLFPYALGGHLDKRPRKLSFKKWTQILLRRRDPRFRKDRTFLFAWPHFSFRGTPLLMRTGSSKENYLTVSPTLLSALLPTTLSPSRMLWTAANRFLLHYPAAQTFASSSDPCNRYTQV